MNKIFLLFLTLILLTGCSSSKTTNKKLPDFYKSGKHIAYSERDYIVGIGFGKDKKFSELDAATKISLQISSTIESSLTSQKKSFVSKSKVKFTQEVREIIERNTNFAHNELIEIIDTSLDGSSGQYYSYAVLSRMKAKSIYQPEVEALEKKFNENYALAEKSLKMQEKQDFLSIYSNITQTAVEYAELLIQYAVIIDDLSVYKNADIFTKLSNLELLFTDMSLNTEWLVYVTINKDEKYSEYKKGSEILFNLIKSKGLKAELLTNYIEDPKEVVTYKHLNAIKQVITGSNKVVLTGELFYDCPYQSEFYSCTTGINLNAMVLDSEKQVFEVVIDDINKDRKDRKTKVVEIKIEKALDGSVTKKLKPIIEEELSKHLKKYEK